MGVFKTKGSHTRVKTGKHAGVEGTITGRAVSFGVGGKKKVKTADGQVIKVKTRNLGRNLGR